MGEAEKHCTKCDELGHYRKDCLKRTANGHIPTQGKYYRKWLVFKTNWFKHNPPNHEGYYECYYCHRWFTKEDITLDHVIPRSAAPELRYAESNIVPACWPCNSKKGSGHVAIENTQG